MHWSASLPSAQSRFTSTLIASESVSELLERLLKGSVTHTHSLLLHILYKYSTLRPTHIQSGTSAWYQCSYYGCICVLVLLLCVSPYSLRVASMQGSVLPTSMQGSVLPTICVLIRPTICVLILVPAVSSHSLRVASMQASTLEHDIELNPYLSP